MRTIGGLPPRYWLVAPLAVLGGIVLLAAIVLPGRGEGTNGVVTSPTPVPTGPPPAAATPPAATATAITYSPTDDVILNPERGLYIVQNSGSLSDGYRPLEHDQLLSFRDAGHTLIKRYFYLTDYFEEDISEEYLAAVQGDFETARAAGAKLIVRFTYTNNPDDARRDASPDRVLRHIEQLAPLLHVNADVIAIVQAGFIGVWGEWAFTDHFSDPYDTDYSDRQEVLERLLEAVPPERFVQVRTPRYKYRMSLTAAQQARVGFHNDCFLRGRTDGGTYLDEALESERAYLAAEVRRTPMGGETCASPGERFGESLPELERFRWSYLNGLFHPDYVERWEQEGMLDEIARRLGYRFELIRAESLSHAERGGMLPIEIWLQNVGWAAPFNPREAEIVLRNTQDGEEHAFALSVDPRHWAPGAPYPIRHQLQIPETMPTGSYEVLLHLPDPAPALHGRPEYSIRLANEHVWEEATGYNDLMLEVEVR